LKGLALTATHFFSNAKKK